MLRALTHAALADFFKEAESPGCRFAHPGYACYKRQWSPHPHSRCHLREEGINSAEPVAHPRSNMRHGPLCLCAESREEGHFAIAIQPIPVHSADEWLQLCARYRDDALALHRSRRPDGAWLSAGFAVECCLKAAIMKRERLNRWPDRDSAPDLWSHDLRGLFKRLGIDPLRFDHRNPVAPALKVVLDWRRDHGYSVGKLPVKFAGNLCEAAFGSNGVIEWIAGQYRLNI